MGHALAAAQPRDAAEAPLAASQAARSVCRADVAAFGAALKGNSISTITLG
jgi:hypothetical protein